MNVQRENVTVPVEGQSMGAFLCRPGGEAATGPAVIVIHAIYGVSRNIQDVACNLAHRGYTALAPNLFWEIGDPPDFTDRASFMQFREKMDDRRFLVSIHAAVEYLRSQPFVDNEHIGIMGFCMGGYYALLATVNNDGIAACADFYGGPLSGPVTETRPRTSIDAAHDLRVPFLGLFGAEDQGISVEQVHELERVVKATGVPAEFHIYPGAQHAFYDDTGRNYQKEAAEDAGRRTEEFFDRYLRVPAGARP